MVSRTATGEATLVRALNAAAQAERAAIVAWLRATDPGHPDYRERLFLADEIERGDHLPTKSPEGSRNSRND